MMTVTMGCMSMTHKQHHLKCANRKLLRVSVCQLCLTDRHDIHDAARSAMSRLIFMSELDHEVLDSLVQTPKQIQIRPDNLQVAQTQIAAQTTVFVSNDGHCNRSQVK
jgi:hypothetical protein